MRQLWHAAKVCNVAVEHTHTHTQRPSIQPYSQNQNPLTCTGLDMAAEESVAPQQINPKLPALVKKKGIIFFIYFFG